MDKKRPLDVNEDDSNKKIRTSSTSNQSVQDKLAEAKARVAKLTASWTQPQQPQQLQNLQQPQQQPSPSNLDDAISKSRAQIARKTQEMKERTQSRINPNANNNRNDVKPGGTGLSIASHPLLADLNNKTPTTTSLKPGQLMQPKFTTVKANKSSNVQTNTFNPYLQHAHDTNSGNERRKRRFQFSRPGKYIQQAEDVRNAAKLEELKRKIDANAKKAGITKDADAPERLLKRQPPPNVEWWDVPLLKDQEKYPESDENFKSECKIDDDDTLITLYVQHPIPIPAPHDRSMFASQDLKLTKQEMKKMRKQRRQAVMSDRRDRIKMGLLPPDPPKVKLSNLMRVLTSDAIQDPTKVEAKVRKDMHKRRYEHEKSNEENKLTKEQKHEKDDNKRMENEKFRGTRAAVFKVRYISNPSHQFKVRKNAQQHALTGCWLQHENFNLVYVEGAEKGVRAYKRLMTVRINWKEESSVPTTSSHDNDNDDQQSQQPQSLADNYCYLIWEGPVRDRTYNRFFTKPVPNDSLAKETLGKNLSGYWDAAKTFDVNFE